MADHSGTIEAILFAHAGTLALVVARIWQAQLPQEEEDVTYMPALVVQQIGGNEATYAMSSSVGLVRLRFQVDSYADDRAGCFALQEQVRDALENHNAAVGGVTITITGMAPGVPEYDPNGKLWRSIHDFEGWGTE